MSLTSDVVVLSWELGEIQSALEASTLILDHLSNQQLATEEEERIAPRLAAAVTNLAITRLHGVCRALRQEVDPRLLLNSYNSEPDGKDIDRDHLVVLRSWRRTEPAPSSAKRPRRRRGVKKSTKPARKAKP